MQQKYSVSLKVVRGDHHRGFLTRGDTRGADQNHSVYSTVRSEQHSCLDLGLVGGSYNSFLIRTRFLELEIGDFKAVVL